MRLETHMWTPRVMEVKGVSVDIQNYQLKESKDWVLRQAKVISVDIQNYQHEDCKDCTLGLANHTIINPLNWYEKSIVIKVKD